jgi:hypothetical protein
MTKQHASFQPTFIARWASRRRRSRPAVAATIEPLRVAIIALPGSVSGAGSSVSIDRHDEHHDPSPMRPPAEQSKSNVRMYGDPD